MPTPMSIRDLIQHARRLARRPGAGSLCLVQFGPAASSKANAARFHFFRNSLTELTAERSAELVELAGGGFCVVAEDEATGTAVIRLIEKEQARDGPNLAVTCERFLLPERYQELRERLSKLAATPSEPPSSNTVVPEDAAPAAAAEELAGPLTPRLLALIEDRMDGVDLEPFVRRQPVYARRDRWQPVYIDQITDLAALAAAFFPAVELRPGEPLVFELQRHLDRLMLVALLLNRPWRRQTIGLRLGYAAWTTDEYRRLLQRLDQAERSRLTIELDWLDALRDAAAGGKVMAAMREAGLRLAIGGIGIDTIPLVQLDILAVDWLKLVFDGARLARLAEPTLVDALRRLDPGRLILSGAEDNRALEVGQRLGIAHYQGPLITRLASRAPAPASGTVPA